VLLACHDNMVEAFPADRANQPLSISVPPWRACRGRTVANAKRPNSADEYTAVTSIPIMDQIGGDLLPATGRCQLIGDPFRSWVRRDTEPQNLSPAVPQVLAATAPVGQIALQIGTLVKLVRVLMLGPVVLVLSLMASRLREEAGAATPHGARQ